MGSTKKFLVKTKSIVPKITSLSSRQTKIQQDKAQIQSKKLTTKQSQIKTNKKPQIPKIFNVSLSHSCSTSLPASLILCLHCCWLPGSSFLRSMSFDHI